PALTADGGPLWALGQPLPDLLAALEGPGCPAPSVVGWVRRLGHDSVFYRSPALSAVVAEMLLEGGDPADALGVLRPALDRFGDDLRLRQLLGLYHSRTGNLAEAVAVLSPLRVRHPR